MIEELETARRDDQSVAVRESRKNAAVTGSCVNYHVLLVCLFKLGEIITCLYTHGNYPVERGKIIMQKKENRINGAMCLSRW